VDWVAWLQAIAAALLAFLGALAGARNGRK
jgi:hypothetical protein